MFVIYTRASIEMNGGLSANPVDQEAAARDWAARNNVEVYYDEAECDEVTSGGSDADDRKLGGLIARCEAGEFAGIIVRDENRFARDVIAGGKALARLTACGAGLIATGSGFDSSEPSWQKSLQFNLMMSIGQAELERNRGNLMGGKLKKARSGIWVSQPPFGYVRDEDGRLVKNGHTETVKAIFRRRAEGETFSNIAREYGLTRGQVRKIVMSKSYLGIQVVPAPPPAAKGEVIEVEGSCTPLVTRAQWEAANAIKGQGPRHTGLGRETQLHGLVKCGVCGNKLHVLSYGKDGTLRRYTCTNGPKCAVGIPVHETDPYVTGAVYDAIMASDPHVAEALNEDARHEAALASVEQAQVDLAEYRDSIDIQRELGVKAFAEGLRMRKEAVEFARAELRKLPKPKPIAKRDAGVVPVRRVVAEVLVFPRAAEHRVMLRWRGSNEQVPVPLAKPAAKAA
jgi:DNA invertase Pin-like site-specific DNA recombinase